MEESNTQIDFTQFVGRQADEVVAAIRASDSSLNVQKIPEGSPVTRDFRIDRVRVFHDEAGIVNSAPRFG